MGSFEMMTPFAPKALIVVEVDESGQVITTLQSTDNRVTDISDVELVGQTYYFGSPFNNYLGRLKTRIPIRVKMSDITAPPPQQAKPSPTQAPTTKPPATKPPTTKPPPTQAPTTKAPPATKAPTTRPPTTQPPTTKPPATKPPTTKPPTTKAPTTQKATPTEKPTTQKPAQKQHKEL